MHKFFILLILFIIFYFPCLAQKQVIKTGYATFYSHTEQGRLMANGHSFDNEKLTAASLEYPLGTRLKITRVKTRKFIIVVVTDQGPFNKNKHIIIDLSRKAAEELDFISQGICLVKIEVL